MINPITANIPNTGTINSLLDAVRARANPGDVERLLLNTAEQDGKPARIGFGQDPGQAGKSQALHLVGADMSEGPAVRNIRIGGSWVNRQSSLKMAVRSESRLLSILIVDPLTWVHSVDEEDSGRLAGASISRQPVVFYNEGPGD